MVFVWFLEIIPCWKKYLFSKEGFVEIPCLGLQFSKGGKKLSLQRGEEWKTRFPIMVFLASNNVIPIFQSWKMV